MTESPAGSVDLVPLADREVLVATSGSGPPTLYLHGLVADLHSTIDPAGPWSGTARDLATSCNVVAPALPGYLGNPSLDGLDQPEDWAYQLVDLLDVMGADSVDVVGVSIGGWIGAELAIRHPSRVRSLALVNPLGLRVDGASPDLFFGAVAPRGVGGFGEARRMLFARPDERPAIDALPDDAAEYQLLRWFTGLTGAARLGWQAPQFQSAALARHAHRIDVPTLAVFGRSDRLIPSATRTVWATAIPDVRRVDLDGAHALQAEQQVDVAEAIKGFVPR
jgi:pimeloyl-ACP methyl ester carboxylesterase